MDPLIFRKASKSDAPTLSELGERTFRNTFASDNTPEDLEAYIARAFRTGQIASELADPAVTFLLVYAGDKPVGYAKLKTGHVPESVQGAKPLHGGAKKARQARMRLTGSKELLSGDYDNREIRSSFCR